MRVFVLKLLIFLTTFNVCAQTDTLFWFVAPDITIQHADRPVFFRVTTFDQPAQVKISLPASNLVLADVLVPANDLFSLKITDPTIIEAVDFQENNGVKIESSTPISAYYEVESGGFNTDIYALKGRFALGNLFAVPLQTLFKNEEGLNATNSIEIVATEDSTIVKFLPNSKIDLDTIEILLNAGQTYGIKSRDDSLKNRLSGSIIEASKPIAVSLTDDSVLDERHYDVIGDQLISMDFAGNLYALPRGYVTIASVEDVELNISGNIIQLDSSNDRVYTSFINAPTLLNSTGNVIVNYFDEIIDFDGSEFGGAILPPLNCSGSRSVAFTRSAISRQFFFYLVFRTSSINDFVLDGESFPIVISDVISLDSNLSYIKIFINESDLETGDHRLENTEAPFHLAIGGGDFVTGFQLGYFSNFQVEIDDTIPICDLIESGDELLNTLDLYGEITVDTLEERVDSLFLKIKVVDEYCVTEDSAWVLQFERPFLNLGDSISFCEGTDSILSFSEEIVIFNDQETDTFKLRGNEVTVYLENKEGCFTTKIVKINIQDTLKFSINGIRDFCADTTGILLLSGNYDTLKLNGKVSNFDTIQVAQDSVVNIQFKNTCGFIDTTESFELFRLPKINLGEDREVCNLSNKIRLPEIYEYEWQDGRTDTIYEVTQSGLYILKATNENSCFSIDSVNIMYKKVDSIIPVNDQIICEENPFIVQLNTTHDSYAWLDGIDTNYREFGEGNHAVEVTTFVNDTVCYQEGFDFSVTSWKIVIPNIITPNGDGLNDDFSIKDLVKSQGQGVSFEVHDRWGHQIFQADDFSGVWVPNSDLGDGVYFYGTNSDEFQCWNRKGWLTVAR